MQNDIISAIATPPGQGAIGVIRISGEGCLHVIDLLFKGKKPLQQSKGYRIHFGKFMDGENVLDEVIASVFHHPNSYTGEESAELSFHGSVFILQRALELLIQHGVRLAHPGEFTQRAFLNGKMDLSQAEAVADLISSESEASHRIAMQQLRGGYSSRLSLMRQELIDFAALVELELDFSEEDVEFADRTKLATLITTIQKEIQYFIQSFKLGNAIKHGVNTVIAGRPNAGKSTLLNAMLQEERAIVSDIPGTTRDTIEEVINIHGVIFRLIDTAGIREATDTIEAIGVQKTMQEIRKGSILIYVYDVTELSQQEVASDLKKLQHEGLHIIVLANKSDRLQQLNETERDAIYTAIPSDHILICGKEEKSVEEVKSKLFSLAIGENISVNQPIVSNTRHFEALMKADQLLNKISSELSQTISGEFLAMDIRQVLFYIGEITGQVHTNDLLDSIFTRFCIGK
jgi:tRNA modification GTPase